MGNYRPWLMMLNRMLKVYYNCLSSLLDQCPRTNHWQGITCRHDSVWSVCVVTWKVWTVQMINYGSRRSHTRNIAKLIVSCVRAYSSCNCSNGCNATKTNRLQATLHSFGFDSWVCKLKLCSPVRANFTYSEGCCSLCRMYVRTKLIQLMMLALL